jgi:hypothetical protein
MRKLAWYLMFAFLFISITYFTMSVRAEENGSSGFIGTWVGEWRSGRPNYRMTFPAKINIIGDGKGGVVIAYYELKGQKVKNPPEIISETPDKLLLRAHSGAEITMKLMGSEILGEWALNPSLQYTATFKKEL